MGILSRIELLQPSMQADIKAAYAQAKAFARAADQAGRMEADEKLADLLNEAGLLADSRDYYYRLIDACPSLIDKSRLLRKIAASHTAQRDFPNAYKTSEEALALLRLANKEDVSLS